MEEKRILQLLETERKDIKSKIKQIDAIDFKKELSLFHVQELTFEEKAPQKEALENVIGTLNLQGIKFVYLLLGDRTGVSFYFGISKDKYFGQELQLDIDDIGRDIVKPSIEGNFRGSRVVELKSKEKKDILEKLKSFKRYARISGVPNENEDSDDFQGIDRLVDIMMGDEFALLVIAEPLSSSEIKEVEHLLFNIYNSISPWCKYSLQSSESTAKNYGKTIGKSSTTTEGTSSGKSYSDSRGYNKGFSKSTGESSSSSSTSNSTSEGINDSFSVSKNTGKNFSEAIGSSESKSEGTTETKGTNKSREYVDKFITKWVEFIDEVLLKRIEYGKNKGLFNSTIYIATTNKGDLIKLSNSIKSIFSGNQINNAPFEMIELDKNNSEVKAMLNFQQAKREENLSDEIKSRMVLYSESYKSIANWLSTKELSVIAALPKKEVVGLSLKEEVEFGLNIRQKDMQEKFLLGKLIKSGSILNVPVFLDKQELDKHTFITGVTGSGKTTTCLRLLDSVQIPFLVIEPAKTEYRILRHIREDILVFTLEDENVAPFRLNPFELMPGEKITSRVDMIKATIEAAFDMEAAIPQIIEAALYRCYEEYGWDIGSSKNIKFSDPYAPNVRAFPTLSELIQQTENVVEEQGFADRLKQDYIGSIKARLQGLIVGAKGFMLDTPRSVDFGELLEKNVVLELEEIKSSAEKSLIMGFVLINLNEAIKAKYREYKEKGKEFKHITLIEEAHRLLAKYVPGESPSRKLGVETFADMLAEVRKYGECLIIVDQIPSKLTPEVLKNTNTKIVHRLFAADDKKAIANTMALTEEQEKFLSNLGTGRAIVSSKGFDKPVQVQIIELEGVSTTKSSLIEEQEIRKTALKYYQANYKKGLIEGIEAYETEPSLEDIEFLLSANIRGLFSHWEKLFNNPKSEFPVDIGRYLQQSKLEEKIDFISKLLQKKFYFKNEEKQKDIHDFIKDVITTKRSTFKRREIARLRIRQGE